MNLNSPNDAYRFLVGNGIVGLCPESQNLVTCMDILSRMCACDSAQAKQARYGQCVQNYVAFASRSASFTGILLSKVSDGRLNFYLNNQLLASLTR